eukprot:4260207-Amphidinium_carterae.1
MPYFWCNKVVVSGFTEYDDKGIKRKHQSKRCNFKASWTSFCPVINDLPKMWPQTLCTLLCEEVE